MVHATTTLKIAEERGGKTRSQHLSGGTYGGSFQYSGAKMHIKQCDESNIGQLPDLPGGGLSGGVHAIGTQPVLRKPAAMPAMLTISAWPWSAAWSAR